MNIEESKLHEAINKLMNCENTIKLSPVDKLTIENQTGVCQRARHTGTYHVKSIDGEIRIKFPLQKKKPEFTLAFLQREHKNYRDKPVDYICEKHEKNSDKNLLQHMLQSTEAKYLDPNKDQIFPAVYQKFTENANFRFMCFDSCATSCTMKVKEAARNMTLKILLLYIDSDMVHITDYYDIPVWPKATVNPRDLLKRIRREQKGGNSKKIKSINIVPDYHLESIRQLSIKIAEEIGGNEAEVNEQYIEYCVRLKEKAKSI